MSDKQKQTETAWEVNDALSRVRGKLQKREADEKSSSLLDGYKRKPYENKKTEIEEAWTEHENNEHSTKAQTDKLTAEEINGFLQERERYFDM